jgi:O-antigen/teichoic acid export membrane protein
MAILGTGNGVARRMSVSYLASDSAAVLFGNVGSVAFRFALNIVIARLAGAHQMGVYIAVSALTFIIGRIADLGLPNALVYFARAQRSSARRCVLLCLVHSVFMLPAAVLLLHFSALLGLANAESSEVIAQFWPVLGALATVQLLGGLLAQLLIPLDGFRSYALAMTISPVISSAICLSLGKGLDVSQLFIAVLIGEAAAAALALWMALRATRATSHAAPLPGFATIYGYALKTYIGTSMKAIGQRGDRLILSWFLPGSMLAAYGVAIALRDTAVLPITARSQVLRNELIDLSQRPDDHTASEYLRRQLIRWSIISAAMAAALALAAPLLVPAFYGEEFRPAVRIFMVLSAALPMLAVATLCWTGMLSQARAGAVSLGLVVSGVFNLVGLYVGATVDGVMGACWGSLIASFVAAGWWLMASFKR